MTDTVKRITPYQRLLDEFREYVNAVDFRQRRLMWTYPKDGLEKGYRLDDLSQRIQAAEQLGYDVVLKHKDGDIQVFYVKKVPDRPYVVEL